MFESQSYSQMRDHARRVAAGRTETGLATGAQVCDALRDVQAAQDMLDGVQADLLARLEDTEGYEGEGASSTTGWAARELRLSPGQAKQRRKAGRTVQALPDAAASLAEGKIRLDHVHELTAGVTKVGADVMVDAQPILMPVAETCDPKELRDAVNQLDETLHPDKLNDQYAKGMDRRDLKTAKCGTGWHVSGFLDQATGTLFNTWLKNASKPDGEGDDRAPSDRRVEAFGRLLDGTDTNDPAPGSDTSDVGATGENAADTDDETAGRYGSEQADHHAGPQPDSAASRRARRPRTAQLLVLADLETLLRTPGAESATLAGFGPIGTDLLGYLTCTGEATGLLTDGTTGGPTPQAKILNVGRTSRLATRKQKFAVCARQQAVCANPGCRLTNLEYHHVAWWDREAGPTDLDNLIGLCNRCHHLVHAEKLLIKPDGVGGFTFHRKTGRRIDDHARQATRRVRNALAQLRRSAAMTAAEPNPANTRPRPAAQGPRPKQERTRRCAPATRTRWPTRHDGQHRSVGEIHLQELLDRHGSPRS